MSPSLLDLHPIFPTDREPYRKVLGVTEAGLFPGVIYVFSVYYRRHERSWRVAIFFGGAALAGAFGGAHRSILPQLSTCLIDSMAFVAFHYRYPGVCYRTHGRRQRLAWLAMVLRFLHNTLSPDTHVAIGYSSWREWSQWPLLFSPTSSYRLGLIKPLLYVLIRPKVLRLYLMRGFTIISGS